MRALSYLAAAAAGALAAYFLDPEQGRRRRAVTRDQLTSCLHRASDASQALARDIRYRARGVANRLEPHRLPSNVPGLQR